MLFTPVFSIICLIFSILITNVYVNMCSGAATDVNSGDLTVSSSDSDTVKAFKSLRAKLQAFLQVNLNHAIIY